MNHQVRFLFLILILSGLSQALYAQFCGTVITPDQGLASQQRTMAAGNTCFLDPSVSIEVRIKYHIVRQTNGTGGFNSANLSQVTNVLNQAFSVYNIVMTDQGFDYIDNTVYYEIGGNGVDTSAEFENLIQINNDQSAINIYIVDGAPFEGRADGVNSKSLVIKGSAATSHIISHELGHCFNLYHTFHGSGAEQAYNSCPEQVDYGYPVGLSIDCVNCGDYVCDTPPDGNLGVSNGYTPLLDNIMSYYTLQSFTSGQAARMRQAFSESFTLRDVIVNLCPKLNGPEEVCESPVETYTLLHGGSVVTWQVSANLEVLSSGNTGIAVKKKSTAPGGSGYIRAVIPGNRTVRKNVRVGTYTPTAFVSVLVDPYMGRIKARVQPTPDATGYLWYVNGVQYTGGGMNSEYVIIPIPPNDCSVSDYQVAVRAVGSCGNSGLYYQWFQNPCYQSLVRYGYSPNPTSETLTITRNRSNNSSVLAGRRNYIEQYELRDLDGKRILYGPLSETTVVDVSGLKKGRYILIVLADGNRQERHHIIID